jgi:pimeloyl-ACP methyl ester carboxylesterase
MARRLPHLDLGGGPPVVILPGYAMRPRTYQALASLLASQCRVIIPDIYDGPSPWRSDGVVADLHATLEYLEIDRATLIGHSFGGGIELEFAVAHPRSVVELVFGDTLAMSREWMLAAEALHPLHLIWLATPIAITSFFESWLRHPGHLVSAAWWGFKSDRREQVATIKALGIPCHVVWAERDSLLARADGLQFAEDLGASFDVVRAAPHGGRIDHDWMYRHPELFMAQLEKLDLVALGGGDGRVAGLSPTATDPFLATPALRPGTA